MGYQIAINVSIEKSLDAAETLTGIVFYDQI